MSKKAKLLKIFEDYRREYTECQALLSKVEADNDKSDEGKAKEKQRIIDRLASSATKHHDTAAALIADGLIALENKWNKGTKGKLMDAGYQAGLSNVLKMIELDAVKSESDIKAIIETYQGDFNAMAAVKAALTKSTKPEIRDFAYLIPEDMRERTRILLNQLKGNVDRYIDGKNVMHQLKSWNTFNTHGGNVTASMDGMAQFVTDSLADDLEVVK